MDKKGTLSEFNDAIEIEIPYMDTEKVRLLIKPTTAQSLVSKLGDMDSPADGTWRKLYRLYQDDTTRTKDIHDKLIVLQDQMWELIQSAYGDIPKNLWTSTDRLKLHRKTGATVVRNDHPGKIQEDCFLRIIADGGGDLTIKGYTAEDASRPSKPENADALEIAYRVDLPIVEAPQEGEPEGSSIVRHSELKSSEDNTTKKTSSKAMFILSLGEAKSGQYFQCYARWTNLAHPDISSHWTGPFGKNIT